MDPATPIHNVFNMTLSSKGPLVVPQYIDMRTASEVEIDLSPLVQNGNIDFVSGAYVDNSDNTLELVIDIAGSNQRIIVPANSQMYVPLMAPNNPKFILSCSASPALIIQVFFYNIPLLPYLWGPGGALVSGDWLTDAQLRATPLAAPLGGAWTDQSIANLSGASETLMAANANRRHLIIQNVAANNMGVNLAGGAAAIGTAGTITLPALGSLELFNYPPTGEITIIGTANDDVTAYEG